VKFPIPKLSVSLVLKRKAHNIGHEMGRAVVALLLPLCVCENKKIDREVWPYSMDLCS
jgi:hypothetical protein